MSVKDFGLLSNGANTSIITLQNSNGTNVKLTNYGATLISVYAADKNGKFEDVILGYYDIHGYEKDTSSMGCIAGRYANRIARGIFEIDGIEYKLECNNGNNHLHGGFIGFNKRLWNIDESEKKNSVKFTLISDDGDQNYPGKLIVTVEYSLLDNDSIEISYEAKSDKATIVNLTNHSYFNLSGDFSKTVEDHEVTIHGDKYTPTDDESIPTGKILSVIDTPFDFTRPKLISQDIDQLGDRLTFGNGYDHNWVLNDYDGTVREVAKIIHGKTGRVLTVFTDQPGLQFYTANYLDGKTVGKNKIPLKHRSGFCLEAQHFPDSPNHPDFPSTILIPGEVYSQRTIYKFGIN